MFMNQYRSKIKIAAQPHNEYTENFSLNNPNFVNILATRDKASIIITYYLINS